MIDLAKLFGMSKSKAKRMAEDLASVKVEEVRKKLDEAGEPIRQQAMRLNESISGYLEANHKLMDSSDHLRRVSTEMLRRQKLARK